MGSESTAETVPICPASKASYSMRAVIWARVITSVTSITEGYAIAVLSGAILLIDDEFKLSDIERNLLMATAYAGMAFGSALSGCFADRFGRIPALFASFQFTILGVLIMTTSVGVWGLIFGRLVSSMGTGIGLAVVSIYMAEVAPSSLRGMFPSLEEVFILVGVSMGYYSNLFFVHKAGSWRWMFAVTAAPPVVMLLPMLAGFIPESPRFLLLQGRRDEAEVSLTHFLADDREVKEVLQMWIADSRSAASWSRVFSPKDWPEAHALFCAVFVVALQMGAGVQVLTMYTATVLDTEWRVESAVRFTAFLGVFRLLATTAIIFFIDSVGRRPLLITSMASITFSFIWLSVAYWMDMAMVWKLLGFVMYFMSYALGVGPVPWVYASEVLGNTMRSKGMAFAVILARLYGGLMMFAFPVVSQSLGLGPSFLALALQCACALLIVVRYMPETKGVPLESVRNCFVAWGNADRFPLAEDRHA